MNIGNRTINIKINYLSESTSTEAACGRVLPEKLYKKIRSKNPASDVTPKS